MVIIVAVSTAIALLIDSITPATEPVALAHLLILAVLAALMVVIPVAILLTVKFKP
jgi:hypothetical protein